MTSVRERARSTAPAPPPGTSSLSLVRRLSASCVWLNVVLVVTGGAVRLTGSGLGCPTWPQCSHSSLVTTPALGSHGVIEFGNRAITLVLEIVALALVWVVIRARPKFPAAWRWLALTQALVVPAQAFVGGLLVLTDLNPYVRAMHFLVSFPILFAAAALYRRALDGTGPRKVVERREVGWLALGLVVTSSLVVIVGSIVTGTGPHAGDPKAERLPFEPRDVTQLHADLVFLLLGLAIASAVACYLAGSRPAVTRSIVAVVVLVVLQGVVGYVQYYGGVPPLLVAIHMLGSSLIFVASSWAYLSRSAPVG